MGWPEVVSAIATSVAALAAAFAAIESKKNNIENTKLAKARVKPSLYITGTSENRLDKTVKINIENIGHQQTMSGIVATWRGTEGVRISSSIENVLCQGNNELIVYVDYKGVEVPNIVKGHVILNYQNILGDHVREAVLLEIVYHYDDLREKYYPILKDMYYKFFT